MMDRYRTPGLGINSQSETCLDLRTTSSRFTYERPDSDIEVLLH